MNLWEHFEEKGLQKGRQEGRQEGEARAREAIIRRMLSLGVDRELIANAVNLSVDAIEAGDFS